MTQVVPFELWEPLQWEEDRDGMDSKDVSGMLPDIHISVRVAPGSRFGPEGSHCFLFA